MIYDNIIEVIGNTPLIKYQGLPEEYADVYFKLESRNPSGSVKDRAVKGILTDLFHKGILKPGDTIIEPTSGNTGVGLSAVGAALGLKVIIVMPETMSVERRQLMKAYGAELVLTPGSEGMQGALDKAEALSEEYDAPIFGQFTNDANVEAHYRTTGPEIIRDLPNVCAFVAGVGTGGTISGVGKALKEHNPDVKIVALEPADSPLLSQGHAGPHRIQGIGANFIPKVYTPEVVDEVRTITNEQAIDTTIELAKSQGVLAGISSGANIYGAIELAKELGEGHVVVTVLPDTGERYLSSGIFGE